MPRIRQRTEIRKRPDRKHEHHRSRLQLDSRPNTRGDVVEHGAEAEDGKVERREIVVQEQLALHEEEGEIVQCPSDEERGADFVVKGNLGCMSAGAQRCRYRGECSVS